MNGASDRHPVKVLETVRTFSPVHHTSMSERRNTQRPGGVRRRAVCVS
ncbi:hypothetical protein ACQP2K_40055 [Microbispora siamensis]